LMLSAAERQELAENAMEQLASGLNKAAEAMQGAEEERDGEGDLPKKDLSNLQDQELYQLLEEAYSYKRPKDRQGKSEIFRELLEKAEENSSGEEQWDINFRKHLHHQDSTGKKKKKKVSESNKKGGSLSNLSCLSDFEGSSGRSGKSKKNRSSVSSRSREGGSLPPTKFENAMLFEGAAQPPPPPPSCLAWDTGGQADMTGESGELQPLLHSTSDSMLRKLVVSSGAQETTIDMEAVNGVDCDSDSNKTEVEEIEMVDMEGRAEVLSEEENTPLLAARHRLESRGRVVGNYGPDKTQDVPTSTWSNGHRMETEEEGKSALDENGNPTSTSSSGPFPIMDPQLRPLSIYRHTPVFRPQKLTVPSMSDREQMENRQPSMMDQKSDRPVEGGKRKVRRKKTEEERGVVKAEDIEGYRGEEDIDSILSFIDGEAGGKKKKNTEKILEKKKEKKSDIKEEKGEKVRRKKEKSVEKDISGLKGVTKKLSVDNSSEAEVIEEEDEMEEEDAREKDKVTIDERSHGKGSPSSLASCGRANSAPSNDSGHVSAEPCSLPSVSSTKEMSIASSPPLDLDPTEYLVAEEGIMHVTEFTKVTKKQRKKRGGAVRERPDRTYHTGSAFSEENRSRGEQQQRGGSQGEGEDWSYRGYTRMRGSREAVTGAKSTCSVPPSDASDTDDHDSVHSLPVGSTRKKEKEARSVSSGHTPQASYADIARHAAALYTQQAGQQQTAVYREQLQYRDSTPAHTKESVSSTEGDCISFHYSGQDTEGTHSQTRAASEPSDSYRPPVPPSHHIQSHFPSKVETPRPVTRAAPLSLPDRCLPPVVILDARSSPVQGGFTFGFEVNEDLLAMSEEVEETAVVAVLSPGDTIAHDDKSIEESNGVNVINQNNIDDNVMMKNLLSLTKKSQNNSDKSSELVKEDSSFDEEDCDVPVEEREVLDLSNVPEENIDLNKFNYDVILGFVSKAWDIVNKELKTGSQVIYYSS